MLCLKAPLIAGKNRNWQSGRVTSVKTRNLGQVRVEPNTRDVRIAPPPAMLYVVRAGDSVYTLSTDKPGKLDLNEGDEVSLSLDGKSAYVMKKGAKELKLLLLGQARIVDGISGP